MGPSAPPTPPDAAALHQALVDRLVEKGAIQSRPVEAAFRAVPRHFFVPDEPLGRVYRDRVIALKEVDGLPVSTASQPTMMAAMLEALDVRPGQRVLEIGTGAGYNAALLAQLVGRRGRVVTVDIDADLTARAVLHLRAAGIPAVNVVTGDGGYGHASLAPYDRIIVTAGAGDIPPAWQEQLAEDGRLLLPLRLNSMQEMTVGFEWAAAPGTDRRRCLKSVLALGSSFVALQGDFAGAATRRAPLDEAGLLNVWAGARATLAPTALAARLKLPPPRRLPTPLDLTPRELYLGVKAWVALHDDACVHLSLDGERRAWPHLPLTFSFSDQRHWAMGLVDRADLALLAWGEPERPLARVEGPVSHPVHIVAYGADTRLAERLRGQLTAWEAAGRPPLNQATIWACPGSATAVEGASTLVLPRQHATFTICW